MLDSGRDTITLRLPESFPLKTESQSYKTSELKDWFEKRTRDLAEKFDRRNGSDHFANELAEMLALKELKHVKEPGRIFYL